ncbi:MAG TPA: hypothetical protein VKU00_09075 [Chthonomonadaceae bacterium]|nr:hypothetical protein [Chthonomonadaceae bacterium]
MSFAVPSTAQPHAELLPNGGFEGGSGSDGSGAGVPRWQAYESGYDVDRQTHHGGDQSIRCDSLRPKSLHGAQAVITLNQTRPSPIIVSGWSKADQVSGSRDSDYSLYIDLEYMDGTPLWGQSASFRIGSHDWERRQVLILPEKPVKTMHVYALFRNHTGTAWFDDFSANQLNGAGIFDGQPLLPLPRIPIVSAIQTPVTGPDGLTLMFSPAGDIVGVTAGSRPIGSQTSGGFWVRDVAADAPLTPVHGAVNTLNKNSVNLTADVPPSKLHLTASITPFLDTLAVEGTLTDVSNTDRAVTLYLALPVGADGWHWDQDIRHRETINSQQEYSNQTRVTVGATGGMSLYPFGCVTGPGQGVAIANQMDMPGVYRIFYNGPTHQLVIAWDFALSGRSSSWPAHTARFHCNLFALSSELAPWGFRAAAQRFYRLNAPNFNRQAKAEGIWAPFTDPSKVPNQADFGFAYHEGDNSLKSDDALGILSFRYTEPMTYWLPMPPEMPRTYENALGLINKNATDPDPKHKEAHDMARAVLNSGTQDESGHFNLEFRNEPWANGAVFVLNPNPEMPASSDKPTKGFLSYTPEMAAKMYGKAEGEMRGFQDGEYLDSLEAFTDTQDYRPSSIAFCPYPLTFDVDSRRPVVPEWFSIHAFTRFLRDDLHNRGKLLMANTTPVRFAIYAPLLDVMGIEVNWLDDKGNYSPDSDETLNLRRTLSATKPYLLLMNTDFDKFNSPMVGKYFQRCMFYGIYPSMFSHNAADHPYWEEPKWYSRDRALFRKYIPILKLLSAAGWEPVTYAGSDHPKVYVERFGSRLFTVMNEENKPADSIVNIDIHALGFPLMAAKHAVNLVTGEVIPVQQKGPYLTIALHLEAQQSLALEWK